MMKLFSVIAIALTTLTGSQLASHAADLLPAPTPPQAKGAEINSDKWHFSASPYFWAAGISGTVGQAGLPPSKLSSNFGTILKDLDFSFMGVMEGRYDRYSLFSDIMYTKISTGGETPYGILTNSVDVTSQTFSGLFGGGYTLFEDERSHVDAVAGARVWYASTKISFDGGLFGGHSGKDSATWVDAVAGLRGKYFFNDSVYISGWGVAGAGQAKLDWDVAAMLGYQFKENLSAVAGYRALGVNYDRDGFVYDVVQKGPVLGLVYHF